MIAPPKSFALMCAVCGRLPVSLSLSPYVCVCVCLVSVFIRRTNEEPANSSLISAHSPLSVSLFAEGGEQKKKWTPRRGS